MTINERVKGIRTALGLSQAEMGNALLITQAAVSAIERGANKVTGANVTRICAEFGVNEEWLRNGNGEMFDGDTDERTIDEMLANGLIDKHTAATFRNFLTLTEEQQEVIARAVEATVKMNEMQGIVPQCADNEAESAQKRAEPAEPVRIAVPRKPPIAPSAPAGECPCPTPAAPTAVQWTSAAD